MKKLLITILLACSLQTVYGMESKDEMPKKDAECRLALEQMRLAVEILRLTKDDCSPSNYICSSCYSTCYRGNGLTCSCGEAYKNTMDSIKKTAAQALLKHRRALLYKPKTD